MGSPLDDLALVVITVIVLTLASVVRPERASCPPQWRQCGVTTAAAPGVPRGSFHCEYFPFTERDKIVDYPGVIHGRIYCDANHVPVQLDDRTVACRSIR